MRRPRDMEFSPKEEAEIRGVLPSLYVLALKLKSQSLEKLGLELVIPAFGGLRTEATQAQLVKWRDEAVAKAKADERKRKGSTARSIEQAGKRAYYQVAPAGKSRHGHGGAFDVKIKDERKRTTENYRKVGELGESLGLRWGGRWAGIKNDPFHFELAITWYDLTRKYAAHVRHTTKVALQSEAAHPKYAKS